VAARFSRRQGAAAAARACEAVGVTVWKQEVLMAEAGSEPEVSGDQPDAGDNPDAGDEPDTGDDQKRKFRAALERKRAQQATQGSGSKGTGTGKIHSTHGPAPSRRSFRRKSGS
jgi:hypothetical protein